MAKTTSISLGDHFESFISNKLKSGVYKNASEVIREGLRRIEQDDLKLQALRERLEIGRQQAERGEFVENFSYEALMSDIDSRINANKP